MPSELDEELKEESSESVGQASALASPELVDLEHGQLAQLIDDHHPADIAASLSRLERDERDEVLSKIAPEELSDLSEHLQPQDVLTLLDGLKEDEKKTLFSTLPDDVRVDVLQELEVPHEREALVALLPATERAQAQDMLSWPEESAGGRMTASIAWVRADLTIKQAIRSMREKEGLIDFLSRIFVVDEQRRIVGQLRLRDLVFHRFGELVEDIMEPLEFSIVASADQEEAAQIIQRYDLAALPVTDEGGILLGAITADDAFEILQEEITEDVEKGAGIAPSLEGESYLGASWVSLAKRRFPWVVALAILGTFSGVVLYQFQGTLEQLFHLTLYLPMVVAAGGNTGGQAATMVIRAMSLGEVTPADALRIGSRELRVGASLGLLVGLIILVEILIFLPFKDRLPAGFHSVEVGTVVAIAMLVQITSSTLLGSMLPLLARRLGIDPAAVASPALASIVDITGLLIYFGTAQLLLGL